MTKDHPAVGLRTYLPAGVLTIDLVKHSQRDKPTIHAIQKTMEETLSTGAELLKITNSYFNYTGDGYVCALVGDSCARLLDFVNAVIPELAARLAQHEQPMRVGADFGLIHLTRNSLTRRYEFFDMPSIQAARLENAAQPGQILCTEALYLIFNQLYPYMFSKTPIAVQTKDRRLLAYEITPFGVEHVQEYLMEYFFGPHEKKSAAPMRSQKILFVDDETTILRACRDLVKSEWPDCDVVTHSDGREVLKFFEPGAFAVAFVDMVMPGINGVELTRQMVTQDPGLVVAMISAYNDASMLRKFFDAGGCHFLGKPFEKRQLINVVDKALTSQSPTAIRNSLAALCDDPGLLMYSLHGLFEQLQLILAQASLADDRAHELLRHKAKQIVCEYISRVKIGTDVLALLEIAEVQISCIARLSRIVGRVKLLEIQRNLEDLVSDLRVLNPHIQFELNCALDEKGKGVVPHGAVLIMIISELMDNSISALGPAGRVVAGISLLHAAGLLQIVVQDTGPGIPPELVNTMFEEGASTKGRGRGLGLSLIRDVVRTLRGEIHYEYRNGAVFRIRIPFAA